MDILLVILFPLALLYDLITRIRNHLYNIGQKRSFRFDTMVICVGNLSLGGSGKTPMVEYLIRLLQPDHDLATLSRGYGRTTQGILFASPDATAGTLGDEPLQFARKFGTSVVVAVGEDRVRAIPEILNHRPSVNVILLDDGFQHRAVDPQFSVLLTEYDRPFFRDFVLPAGRLRESRKGAKRASVIVVTKCPDSLEESAMKQLKDRIRSYAGEKAIFFSRLVYGEPIGFQPGITLKREVILLTGIANADKFREYVATHYTMIRHFRFGDHHRYTSRDLAMIAEYYVTRSEKPVIMTTEKDMVRLLTYASHEAIATLPWFYVPITIAFLKDGPEFDKIVVREIENAEKHV